MVEEKTKNRRLFKTRIGINKGCRKYYSVKIFFGKAVKKDAFSMTSLWDNQFKY